MDETKVGARNSGKDQERLQTMHDYAVENGALCDASGKALGLDEVLVFQGSEVKALDGGRVAGYLVRFGDASETDLTGDYFAPDTDYGDSAKSPVLYQHGMDKRLGRKRIGVGELKKDDLGVWIEAQLNMRDEYEKAIYELAKKGKLGWSSGTAGHLVERDNTGKILAWPLGLDASLTPTPAEPRNHAVTLKSLVTPEAAIADTGIEKHQTAAKPAKEFEMEKEEFKALLDENTVALTTVIEEKANAAATKAVKEFADSLPEIKAAMNIEVTDAPEDRPFKSIAENLLAVKADVLSHGNGDNQFPRLRFLKATGASEGIAADGGFLLEPTLVDEIIKPQHEDGPFSNDVRRLPVGANSNYGWLNAVDETSRATGSRWGGIRGYRLAEAATKTASKPTFRRIQWELKKYAAVVVATDELLADSKMFSEIVKQGCAEELNFMLNEDIFDGVGTAGPQGFMNSGALISVTRTDANKILGADISAMYNRMDVRSRNSAKWYVGNDSSPQFDNLFAVGSTAVLYPYGSIAADGVKRLYGRPIVTTEFNPSLGSLGDIVFADMNQYLLWTKGGIESATSIHVYFLSDETAFRFVMRVDGKATVNSALTPFKGSTSTSPFVALTAAS